MTTIKRLYEAANSLVTHVGAEGEVDSRHQTVLDLMAVLRDMDGGVYQHDFLDAPPSVPPEGPLVPAIGELVVPPWADPVGNPPQSWRVKWGQVETVGDLRACLHGCDYAMPLMVRNGPLPTIYYHFFDGVGYAEFDL